MATGLAILDGGVTGTRAFLGLKTRDRLDVARGFALRRKERGREAIAKWGARVLTLRGGPEDVPLPWLLLSCGYFLFHYWYSRR